MAEIRQRMHYLDWMRITAFGLLIFYHAARAFFPEDPWHISDPDGSLGLRNFMDLMARWRLPLLFFISGIASSFVLERRTWVQFTGNRLLRLFLPLIFAMLIIVPPQVWMERSFYAQTDLGFFGWYFTDAFTQGTYREGNISWHHLWYIAYLFVMTMLLLPLMLRYKNGGLKWLKAACDRLVQGPQVLLIVLLPFVVENTLGRIWPGHSNALLGDWGWLALNGTWFLLGFLIAPSIHTFAQTARKIRLISGALWLGMTCIIAFAPGSDDFKLTLGDQVFRYDNMLTVPIAWMAIVTLFGLFQQYANKGGAVKRYLNTAVYPLYIIHQTIALAAVYLVVPLDLNVWIKLFIVTVATFGVSLFVYHFGVRNLGPLKALFGESHAKK